MTLPHKALKKIQKRTKTRWSPNTPGGAQSLLDNIERALLKGKSSDDPTLPPYTTVEIPAAAANYLLDAIRMIRGGVDANAALHLVADKRGRKSNNDRDTIIAIQIRERMKIHGESQEAATAEIGRQFNLSHDGAVSARKNGNKHEGADFFDEDFLSSIREFGGDEAVHDYIAHLINRAKQG